MKNLLIFILILTDAVTFTVPLAAQTTNSRAYFVIDTTISAIGYQANTAPTGIDAQELVGFAVYVKDFDLLKSFNIDATWDGSLATYNTESGVNIYGDAVTVNGESITQAEEICTIGEMPLTTGEVIENGHYYAEYAGDNVVSGDFELLYYLVLETSETFSANQALEVIVSVSIGYGSGIIRSLGEQTFHVNSDPVDVKDSKWREIKQLFKE